MVLIGDGTRVELLEPEMTIFVNSIRELINPIPHGDQRPVLSLFRKRGVVMSGQDKLKSLTKELICIREQDSATVGKIATSLFSGAIA